MTLRTIASILVIIVALAASVWLLRDRLFPRDQQPDASASTATPASGSAGPLFTAALELWIAARTDAELHAALIPFERGAGRGLVQLWRAIAGDLAAHPRFDAVLELSLHMARGMALQKILRDDDVARRRSLDLWREMASHALRA